MANLLYLVPLVLVALSIWGAHEIKTNWWYVIPLLALVGTAIFIWREMKKSPPHLDQFFMYGHRLTQAPFFATVVAASMSLGAAILAFFQLGYYLPWVALLAMGTWALGFYFHWLIMKKIHGEISQGINTIHNFLGTTYRSDFLSYITAAASVVAYAGAYGVEIIAITKLTGFVLPDIPDLLIVMLLALFVGWYTSLGGFTAVVKTDKVQIALIGAGLLVIVGATFWWLGKNALLTIVADWPDFDLDFVPLIMVIGILCINLPWQISDMAQWQRSLGCDSVTTVKKGLFFSVIGILIGWGFIIVIGRGMHGIALGEGDAIQNFLRLLSENPYIYACVLLAASSAILSTVDSQIIAASQAVICNIKYGEINKLSDEKRNKLLPEARQIVWGLAILSPIFIYLADKIIGNVLHLFFMILAAPLSLVPSVIFAVSSPSSRVEKLKIGAIISVSVGLLISLALFVWNVSLEKPNPNLIFLSPVISLMASAATFWVAYYFIKKGENTGA